MAGLKPSGLPDLAVVDAGRTVPATAVQTTNQVQAAPVRLTARHLSDGRARAVLLNAGNANVCTGEHGETVARDSAAGLAALLGCRNEDVLVCSTGLIGAPPDPAPLLDALPALVAARSADGGTAAATAVMTTDTRPKETALRADDDQGTCVVGGFTKGAGMIAPELATMLAVLVTDAPLEGPVLDAALAQACADTFARIDVDGCQSTNDAVVLLATGSAPRPTSLPTFQRLLTAACADLAEQIVRDGEGASHLLRVRVVGARASGDALAVGRQVARSALVKTALAGGDPNWGRIMAAIGASPVRIDPDRVSISFGRVTVCRFGVATAFDHGQAVAALRSPDVALTIDLGLGRSDATVLTCDLTHDYVTINADYTT